MFRYVFNLVLIIGLSCQNIDESGDAGEAAGGFFADILSFIEHERDNRTIQQKTRHEDETNVNRNEYEKVTTKPLDNTNDSFNPMSIYIYVGIGVGILVLFAIQTCCLIWYFKRAKLQRVNDIARSLNENTSNETARYYKRPTASAIKVKPDLNVYESLAEVQKAPTPPPINSLPKTPRTRNKPAPLSIISLGSPNSIRSQKSTQSSNSTKSNVKDVRTPNSIRHREQMPLPHEIPKPDIPLSKKPSTTHRPKLSSPTETSPMVNTLPSKIANKSKVTVNKSNTFNSSQDTIVNTELLEKLRKRAEINASIDESSTLTNHSNSLRSRKPVEMKPRLQGRHQQREPRAQLQVASRQVQYTGGNDNRESSSDNEWTMEQLEPYHIYNI